MKPAVANGFYSQRLLNLHPSHFVTRLVSIALILATVVFTAQGLCNSVGREGYLSVAVQAHHSVAPDLTIQWSEDEEQDTTNDVKKETPGGMLPVISGSEATQPLEPVEATKRTFANTSFLTLLQLRI